MRAIVSKEFISENSLCYHFRSIDVSENKLKVTSGRWKYIFPQKILKALWWCQSTQLSTWNH